MSDTISLSSPKKSTPLSIRLTAEERAWMQRQSNGGSLSAFARERIFGRKSFNDSADNRSIHPDKVAMAQALALLGKSRMSESFNALAESARIGALPVHEETEKAINDACKQVAQIKSLLMAALGIKER